jgi:molybdopterin-guanine dinucleotide biosynthesis protein A
MNIAKKPKRISTDIISTQDSKADAFIAGARQKSGGESSVRTHKTERQPVLIRFDSALLSKVEHAAQKRGISRSAWIQYVVSVALEKGEG